MGLPFLRMFDTSITLGPSSAASLRIAHGAISWRAIA